MKKVSKATVGFCLGAFVLLYCGITTCAEAWREGKRRRAVLKY